jgi:POTRA domain, FtsQ-type
MREKMKAAPKQQTPKSRAESVRDRRTKVTRKKMDKRAMHMNMSTASAIPITMRAGIMGTPVVDRARIRPRHHLSIPFRSSAELVLPSFPVVKPGWRLLSGFMTILLIAAIIFVTNAVQFRVNNLQVTGLNRLKVSDIADTLKISNSSIFAIDPDEITQTLDKEYPELKDISVAVTLPANLNLTVTEREPILSWQYSDLTVWVDAEGYLFPARGKVNHLLTVEADSAPPLMPVVATPTVDASEVNVANQNTTAIVPKKESTKIMDQTLLTTLLQLHSSIPQNNILVYRDMSGLGWADPNGWEVYVGKQLGDLDQKLVVYKTIVAYLDKQNVKPAIISVENLYAPFYRMEK